jgi:hypothetical protein
MEDFTKNIPIELFSEILVWLDYRSLLRASRVNKFWNVNATRYQSASFCFLQISDLILRQLAKRLLNRDSVPPDKTLSWLLKAHLVKSSQF